MRFQLPEGTFPRLALGADVQQAIVEQADRLIADTMRQSDAFRAQKRHISRRDWKQVKAIEGVQVHRRRRPRRHESPQRPCLLSDEELDSYSTPPTTASKSKKPTMPFSMQRSVSNEEKTVTTASTASSSFARTASCWAQLDDDEDDEDIPGLDDPLLGANLISILLTGQLDGQVEDFALGSLAATERATRMRHSHFGDDFDDVRVLATIHAPTETDPFRFLGVKWLVKNFGPFIRRRDFVYIEATGLTLDADGQCVAYRLSHSVDLPQIPELAQFDIKRGEMSTCIIARPQGVGSIEIYGKGLVNNDGHLVKGHATSVYAAYVASVAHTIDRAYSIKALWAMRHAFSLELPPESLDDCHLCTKRLSLLDKMASTVCQLCRRTICKRCSVQKKLTVDDGTNNATTKCFPFCMQCLLDARELPARQAAVAALLVPRWTQSTAVPKAGTSHPVHRRCITQVTH